MKCHGSRKRQWTIGPLDFGLPNLIPIFKAQSPPKIPRGVAGCDFLRWRRPIPRSLFGPDRPCLLFEAGLYGDYTAVHHGGFQPFPWIVAFFWGMLYSYTYILEVKLLAGPKGAGNQPDVIILYVNIYIYICIFIYTYYLNSSMKHFKWDNAQKALLSSYEHVNRFCACGKHMLRVYYKTLYCSCFAIEQDTDNRKKKHIKYHWGLA